MDVSLDDAYAEACRALGETIVLQRLTNRLLAEVTAERDQLRNTKGDEPPG